MMSSSGREFKDALAGMFPRRIRSILVVNGGMIVRVAVQAAKLILPKKLTKRIGVISAHEQLKDIVSEEWLLQVTLLIALSLIQIFF